MIQGLKGFSGCTGHYRSPCDAPTPRVGFKFQAAWETLPPSPPALLSTQKVSPSKNTFLPCLPSHLFLPTSLLQKVQVVAVKHINSGVTLTGCEGPFCPLIAVRLSQVTSCNLHFLICKGGYNWNHFRDCWEESALICVKILGTVPGPRQAYAFVKWTKSLIIFCFPLHFILQQS